MSGTVYTRQPLRGYEMSYWVGADKAMSYHLQTDQASPTLKHVWALLNMVLPTSSSVAKVGRIFLNTVICLA